MKFFKTFLLIFLLLGAATTQNSFARSYGRSGGGGFSSHSFSHVSHSYSSHSFGSFSRSSSGSSGSGHSFFSSPKPSYGSSSHGKYSRSASTSDRVSTHSTVATKNTTFNRASSAHIMSVENTKKYSVPPQKINTHYYHSTYHTLYHYRSPHEYYRTRQADLVPLYHRYPEPAYVYHMAPNYGIWDTYFLYLILANSNRPSYYDWAYSHQNDPGYQAWYNNMQVQAQTNASVQQQLTTLNQHVAMLQQQHAPVTTALPNQISPAIAISPTTVHSGHSFWFYFVWFSVAVVVIVFGGIMLFGRRI